MMIMFINYEMVLFSKFTNTRSATGIFNYSAEMNYMAGYFYVCTLGFTLFVNIWIMVKNTCGKLRRKRALKKKMKAIRERQEIGAKAQGKIAGKLGVIRENEDGEEELNLDLAEEWCKQLETIEKKTGKARK